MVDLDLSYITTPGLPQQHEGFRYFLGCHKDRKITTPSCKIPITITIATTAGMHHSNLPLRLCIKLQICTFKVI